MSISDIISVNTRIGSSPQEEAGFGTRVLIGQHSHFATRTKLYSGSVEEQLKALASDGFSKRSQIYRAIEQTGNLDRASSKVIVARRAEGTKQVDTLTVTADPANLDVSVKVAFGSAGINTSIANFKADAADTDDELAVKLRDAIVASGAPYTITLAANVLTLTSDMPIQSVFTSSAQVAGANTAAYVASAEAIDAVLDEIRAERPEAYRYELLDSGSADILAFANWASTKDVLPFACTSDLNCVQNDPSSIAFLLHDGQKKMNLFVADRIWEAPHVGIDSNRATFDLDEVNPTYNNVALAGYSALKVDGSLSAAQKAELTNNNCFFLHDTSPASRTWVSGKMCNDASGSRWTDHQVSRDYINKRLQEKLLDLITREAQAGAGLGYDSASYAKVVSTIQSVWERAKGETKHVHGPISIDLQADELTIANVLTRVLRVKWRGKINNKINQIEVDGLLLLEV